MNGSDSPAPVGLPPSELDARTRARLLRAGVQVFDKKGYDAASVREIVEMAGVTKPALYYHFGSKEGLLKAILEEAAREFEMLAAQALARPGTTRDRIVELCEDMRRLFSQHLSVVRVTHAVFMGPTDTAPDFDFATFEDSLGGAFEQMVREGQASGELNDADPADVALAVTGVTFGVFGRQLHPQLPAVSPEQFRRILNLVLNGIMRAPRSANAQEAGEQRQ